MKATINSVQSANKYPDSDGSFTCRRKARHRHMVPGIIHLTKLNFGSLIKQHQSVYSTKFFLVAMKKK